MRTLLAAAILLACVVTAAAGDGSAVRAIGFSADGRYFAYEQYGERDGDGQLYAEIYTVDVRDDRFEEAPVREVWTPDTESSKRKGERPTLAQVRERAAAQAVPTLKRLGIGTPGWRAGAIEESRGDAVLSPVQVGPVRDATATGMDVSALGLTGRLTLRPIPIDTRRCANRVVDGIPQGIVLTLERQGRTPLTIMHERTIPAARGCPDRYGLATAYASPRSDGSTALAIFIQYFYQAFEGPDRRFFVVTSAVR
jgi:predicted secreted protein